MRTAPGESAREAPFQAGRPSQTEELCLRIGGVCRLSTLNYNRNQAREVSGRASRGEGLRNRLQESLGVQEETKGEGDTEESQGMITSGDAEKAFRTVRTWFLKNPQSQARKSIPEAGRALCKTSSRQHASSELGDAPSSCQIRREAVVPAPLIPTRPGAGGSGQRRRPCKDGKSPDVQGRSRSVFTHRCKEV